MKQTAALIAWIRNTIYIKYEMSRYTLFQSKINFYLSRNKIINHNYLSHYSELIVKQILTENPQMLLYLSILT